MGNDKQPKCVKAWGFSIDGEIYPGAWRDRRQALKVAAAKMGDDQLSIRLPDEVLTYRVCVFPVTVVGENQE